MRSYSASGTRRLRQLAPDRLHRLERAGLAHLAEVDHALAEQVEVLLADDRVARDAALAAARRDLADDLARQRLRVDLALAGDDVARAAHRVVELQRVEHVRRARLERRVVLG